MSSSLALRSLFKALVTADGLTTRGPGLHGLTLQAKALAAAAASHEQPGDPVLLVVPTDAELEAVAGDIRFFLGAIEGLSDSALGNLVLPLPSLQVDPYRALAPHMRVSSARARALLAQGAAGLFTDRPGGLRAELGTPGDSGVLSSTYRGTRAPRRSA